MAKHAASLAQQQEQLTQRLNEQHQELTTKVDELASVIKVQEARATLVKVTPNQGRRLRERHQRDHAGRRRGAGRRIRRHGGAAVGVLPRNKKGDGVLAVGGGESGSCSR